MRRLVTIVLLTLLVPLDARTAWGQEAAAPVAAPPAARASDVSSEDAIIAALYGAISGPAGQKRDWERFRPLFIRDARLIVARAPRPEGPMPPRVMTVEELSLIHI